MIAVWAAQLQEPVGNVFSLFFNSFFLPSNQDEGFDYVQFPTKK